MEENRRDQNLIVYASHGFSSACLGKENARRFGAEAVKSIEENRNVWYNDPDISGFNPDRYEMKKLIAFVLRLVLTLSFLAGMYSKRLDNSAL